MRILESGHVYEVINVDGPGTQIIRFVRRRDDLAELLDHEEWEPGILSQELVRVLIDRVRYLNDEDPCYEDVDIIHMLRDILRKFEARASRRKIEKLQMPETAHGCAICHHVLCEHHGSDDEPPRIEHEARR